jgi:hypothetical protein
MFCFHDISSNKQMKSFKTCEHYGNFLLKTIRIDRRVGMFWSWDVFLGFRCFGALNFFRLWTYWSWDVSGLGHFMGWDVL